MAGSEASRGKAVVLLSGGLDSTVLLHYAAKELGFASLYALSFDYGQKHAVELEMARWQCARLPQVAEHRILPLSFFAELLDGASTLVRGGAPVPGLTEVAEADRSQPPTYVPHRNLMLLSLAAAFAESRGATTILYGAQMQDEYGYWDCTAEFIRRLNDTLALNRRQAVTVLAPFADWRKSAEIRLGARLGVDFSKTWSCYRGGRLPCQACPTCVERSKAFEEAGIPDPLL